MFDGFLEERHEAAADAGIGVADVETSVFLDREGHGTGHVFLRRGISDQRNGAPAARLDRRGCRLDLGSPIQRDDGGAFGCEQKRAGTADAAGCTGDEGDFAL